MLEIISSVARKRDQALLSLLYWSARRINELLSLERGNIRETTFDDETVYVAVFKLSKTKKQIKTTIGTILTPNPITDLFLAYLDAFDKFKKKGKLFTITQQRVWQICKEIDPGIHPHWFRHCRATHLAEYLTAGELMAYMGWTSLATAAKYVHHQPIVHYRKQKQEEW